MAEINFKKLKRWFPYKTIQAGITYARKNKVLENQTDTEASITTIHASVQGSQPDPYQVTVKIKGSGENLVTSCTCPMATNCKHVVAAIIEADLPWLINRSSAKKPSGSEDPKDNLTLNEQPDRSLINWLDALPETITSPIAQEEAPVRQEIIIFILDYPQHRHKNKLAILPQITRPLKKGGYAKPKPFYPSNSYKKQQISATELEWFGLLDMLAENTYNYPARVAYELTDQKGLDLLKRLLATERCYWQSMAIGPIKLGPTIQGKIEWELQTDGTQKLTYQLPEASQFLLPIEPAWYLDKASCCAGPLDLGIPEQYQSYLLNMPAIPAKQVQSFTKQLQAKLNEAVKLPSPKVFTAIETKFIKPQATLDVFITTIGVIRDTGFFFYETIPQAAVVGEVNFTYGHLSLSPTSNQQINTQVEGDKILQYSRDRAQEKRYLKELDRHKLNPLKSERHMHSNDPQHLTNRYYIADKEDLEAFYQFKHHIAPQLIQAGWQINYDPACLELTPIEIDVWYTDLNEESAYDWFGLELGIMVQGEKIDLLPHLVKALRESKLQTNENNQVLLQIPNKGVLSIPNERIQSIVNMITQLIDTDKPAKDQEGIKVSRYHAALLAEMEKAFHATEMRWFGNQRLIDLGRKLKDFKHLEAAKVPPNFNTELRPYQQHGINWLQFLREFNLNGILADDMGLGKTIQTLAHLSIEKAANRMHNPCLIVAPTSVVHNWQREIQHFTPYLKTLVLQGMDRKEKFDQIAQSDIVLTTYPLLNRDKAYLLAQEYYQLILDEAQVIKNAQAKMTQIIQQFKAQHRLCLTGTPLENHLGELWSLFHFLMPGLLGNRRQFNTRYRAPIEKQQDKKAQEQLAKLIKPFILRRTKKEVILDLPPKTEMLRNIELDKQQRDLYESVRLTMHQKVRQTIDEKGIERSQIIILDALLKLRQICCDPRLLSIQAAKNIQQSAKLETLMDMLMSMCEEGRRILVFSQFTKMLDLIAQALQQKNIGYVMLTGSTQDRNKPIQAFQAGQVPVFLISLKAGGTGLNLTAADTVIHYDPWWNPAVEQQAADRAYRIGQDKPVFVYKLVASNTVEEKMLEMQEKKKSYMDAIFSGGEHKGKITKQDLDMLFAR